MTRPITHLADVSAAGALAGADEHQLRIQLVANAGAALLVLVVTAVFDLQAARGNAVRAAQDATAASAIVTRR